MIKSINRFHGHGSLRYVYRLGKTARTRWFMARFVPNPTRKHSRFAVIVSKKIFKSAVKRNRIRRRVFELIRPYITGDAPVIDIAITVYAKDVLDAPSAEIKSQIDELLLEAGFTVPDKRDRIKSNI